MICLLYGLFVLADFSANSNFLINQPLLVTSQYFADQFLKRLETLATLSFLLTCLILLQDLSKNLEVTAFQAGTLCKKRLLKPFFFIASLLSITIYVNHEYFLPSSLIRIQNFEIQILNKNNPQGKTNVYVKSLGNGGKIFYGEHSENIYKDVYLIFSPENLWRLAKLEKVGPDYVGFDVKEITKEKGNFFLKNSLEFKTFDNLTITPLLDEKDRLQEMRLSDLLNKVLFAKQSSYEALTSFLLKLFMPLLPILCVLVTAPYCLKYQRNAPQFTVFTLTVVGFLLLLTTLNILTTLSKSAVISPTISISMFFVLLYSYFGWNFTKNC